MAAGERSGTDGGVEQQLLEGCSARGTQAFRAQFLGLLHLQDRGTRSFRGAPAPDADRHARMFGGQVLAQALAAGSFTVPIEWTCHSLHACFVRPGHSARPTDFQVFEMRDGKRGGLRKVVAMQHDEVICELTASFAVDAEGPEHQLPMPPTAAADSFPSASACGTEGAGARQNFGPIELVLVDRRADTPAAPQFGLFRTWARVCDALNDDPHVHRCALTYAPDVAAVEPSMRATGTPPGDPDMQVASLDHAIWFHRPFRFDHWLLFVFDCASLAGHQVAVGAVIGSQGLVDVIVGRIVRRPGENAAAVRDVREHVDVEIGVAAQLADASLHRRRGAAVSGCTLAAAGWSSPGSARPRMANSRNAVAGVGTLLDRRDEARRRARGRGVR